MRVVKSEEELFEFIQEINGSCVIKPIDGSCNELVFKCSNKKECESAWRIINKGLGIRNHKKMYKLSPRRKIRVLAEKLILIIT